MVTTAGPGPIDWDDAYANGAHIEGGSAYPAKWAAAAAGFRAAMVATGRAELDRPYGPLPREVFDLFHPEGEAAGTVVFVHGGFWKAFDKSSWSHLAAGALAHGWRVAMPSYTLCPEARIGGITRQIERAVEAVAGRTAGPLRLTGHSAGGHLVTRLLCADAGLSWAVRERVVHTVSISGLHDLRPLLKTAMNQTLGLDGEEVVRESPALAMPHPGVSVTCWVGADERPEFIRQNALLANIWSGLDARMTERQTAARHHYNVIEDLADPHSPLVGELLGGGGSAR
ncbi:alpha-beta hydrolase superfamily lysophospholipase [Azospirillum agricola]|uniref:alpha/beta hydrolase n=1 Tax=Azospirillum agricola TaxID=1720247 RepID=UPI001AE1A66B|nr:alpha/beta hydrolase [Azospirillum agricola]MBP2231195.1 alpha-beta hydrolase superfamily lysophospholipase [Azospirillum agricola]